MATTPDMSIYALLEAGADPRERGSGFPTIAVAPATAAARSGAPTFAPGLQDALFGHGTSNLPAVAHALRLLERGDLAAAERCLSSLRFVDNVDEVMSNIDPSQVGVLTTPAFDLLRLTRDYEVAKWTILLTHVGSAVGRGLEEEEVERLTVLARHAELTPVVTVVLSIASDQNPDRLRSVIELAPYVSGWGLADLIGRRGHYVELRGDPDLDRLLLISVARNADGLDMELAHPLAESIGLRPMVERALAFEDDEALREAVAWQLHTLLVHSSPHGGIDDVAQGRPLLARWAEHTALRAEVHPGERLTLATAAREIEQRSPEHARRWLEGAELDLDVPELLRRATAEDWTAIALITELRPPAAIEAARELLGRGALNAWVVELVRRSGDDEMRTRFVRHALTSSDGYLREEAIAIVRRDAGMLEDPHVRAALRAVAAGDAAPALRAEAQLALVGAGQAGLRDRMAWRRATRRGAPPPR